MFDQPEMERHLRKLANESTVGDYQDSSEVVGIEENTDFAEATYKDVQAGHQRRVRTGSSLALMANVASLGRCILTLEESRWSTRIHMRRYTLEAT